MTENGQPQNFRALVSGVQVVDGVDVFIRVGKTYNADHPFVMNAPSLFIDAAISDDEFEQERARRGFAGPVGRQ